jgi:hypothetical protein
VRWIERSIHLPLPPGEAFPLAVEPGTASDWLVQLQEVRPRGFLRFRPRVRHGGVSLDLEVEVVRVTVPEELEAAVRWREVDARLHLLLVPTEDEGTLLTLRVGVALSGVLRGARPLILAEIARLLTWDLRRLRRLALAAETGATAETGDAPASGDEEAPAHEEAADAGSGPSGRDDGGSRRDDAVELDPADADGDAGSGTAPGDRPAPDVRVDGDEGASA